MNNLTRVEMEANYFAGGFLMPKKQFVYWYHELDGNIADLAAKFLVSEKDILVRIQTLQRWGLLNPPTNDTEKELEALR